MFCTVSSVHSSIQFSPRQYSVQTNSSRKVLLISGALEIEMVVRVVGLSQPVLDLSVRVSHQFLTRHQLAVNQSYRLEEGEEDVMFTEVRQMAGVSFSAGGSTNNTLRTASILLAKRGQEGVVGGSGIFYRIERFHFIKIINSIVKRK